MSKIICDVCGTSYQDSATQCPICGCASADSTGVMTSFENGAEDAGHGTYTYVKGGRFSKTNVKKRNNGKQPARMEADEKPAKKEKKEQKEKSNKGLIIAVLALLLAIILVVIYIVVNYFVPTNNVKGGKSTTAPITEPVETDPVVTEPVVENVACTDLTCPLTMELTEEGQTQLLEVSVLPEETTDAVIFTSADESIATVDADGNVTAIAAGETVIEVVCGEMKAFCEVTCNFEAKPVENEENETTDQPENQTTNNTESATGEGSNHLLESGEYKLNTYKGVADFTLPYPQTHEMVVKDKNNNVVDVTITSRGTHVCKVEGNKIISVGSGYCTLVIRFGEGENDFFTCIVRVP